MNKYRVELGYRAAPTFAGVFEGKDPQQAYHAAARFAYNSGWPSTPTKTKWAEVKEENLDKAA